MVSLPDGRNDQHLRGRSLSRTADCCHGPAVPAVLRTPRFAARAFPAGSGPPLTVRRLATALIAASPWISRERPSAWQSGGTTVREPDERGVSFCVPGCVVATSSSEETAGGSRLTRSERFASRIGAGRIRSREVGPLRSSANRSSRRLPLPPMNRRPNGESSCRPVTTAASCKRPPTSCPRSASTACDGIPFHGEDAREMSGFEAGLRRRENSRLDRGSETPRHIHDRAASGPIGTGCCSSCHAPLSRRLPNCSWPTYSSC